MIFVMNGKGVGDWKMSNYCADCVYRKKEICNLFDEMINVSDCCFMFTKNGDD